MDSGTVLNMASTVANSDTTKSAINSLKINGQDFTITLVFGAVTLIIFFLSPLLIYKKGMKEIQDGRGKLHNLIFTALTTHVVLILAGFVLATVFSTAQSEFGTRGHFLNSYIGAFFTIDWTSVTNSISGKDLAKYSMSSVINLVYMIFNMVILILPVSLVVFVLNTFYKNLKMSEQEPMMSVIGDTINSTFAVLLAVAIHTSLPFIFLEDMISDKTINKDYSELVKDLGGNGHTIPLSYSGRMSYIISWDNNK